MNLRQIELIKRQPMIVGCTRTMLQILLPFLALLLIFLPTVSLLLYWLVKFEFFEEIIPKTIGPTQNGYNLVQILLLILINGFLLTFPVAFLSQALVKIFTAEGYFGKHVIKGFHPKGFSSSFLFIFLLTTPCFLVAYLCLFSLITMGVRPVSLCLKVTFTGCIATWILAFNSTIAYLPAHLLKTLTLKQIWQRNTFKSYGSSVLSSVLLAGIFSYGFFIFEKWFRVNIVSQARPFDSQEFLQMSLWLTYLIFWAGLPLMSIILTRYYKYYHKTEEDPDNFTYDALIE